ncbi:MAG: radical SAM protein, partial [Clostridiales bacterium]
YAAYHRPCGYSLADVHRSLAIAHQYQVPVALNLLAYPGYTDREKVLEALIGLCREFAVKQIQLRNLNIDPRIMKEFCPDGIGLGLGKMISILENEIPEILVGNYSRADIKSAKNKK